MAKARTRRTAQIGLCLSFVLLLGATDAFAKKRVRFKDLPVIAAKGDTPIRLRANASGGVVFTSSNPKVARIKGSKLRIVRPGVTRITAISRNGSSRSASQRLTVGTSGGFLGSTLASAPNLLISPSAAPIFDPISGAPTLVASGQTSCTLRNAGYLGSFQIASIVPGSGFIRDIRVRCGPNPAAMQIVIMSGSPGLYGTALRTSQVFVPRANTVTTVRVNLPVTRALSGSVQTTDAVGLNVFGSGTMPLVDQGTGGTFATGSALLQHWYPIMRIGEPENGRAYTVDGIELLLAWEYIQVGEGVTR